MTYRERREFRSFVAGLTAETAQPWMVEVPPDLFKPMKIRIDPLACQARGPGLRGDLIVTIPEWASPEEAKALVIDRLAGMPRLETPE